MGWSKDCNKIDLWDVNQEEWRMLFKISYWILWCIFAKSYIVIQYITSPKVGELTNKIQNVCSVESND